MCEVGPCPSLAGSSHGDGAERLRRRAGPRVEQGGPELPTQERKRSRPRPRGGLKALAAALLYSMASGKYNRKPLFTQVVGNTVPPGTSTVVPQDIASMDLILKEISAVGQRLGSMDVKISDLATEMKTIRMDLNCFHTKVEILDQRTTFLEEKLDNAEYWGPDIWHLKQKVIDLEDRARRNNIRFYGIPEKMEVNNDVKNLLLTLIPRLLNISFEHPLELQRAHRIRSRTSTSTLESRPRSIIACLLRHEQVRQILTAARKHGPYDLEGNKVFIAADFSTETNAK
ncbi:hypothetical protein NDU88_001398 [Pleurodeles waltl]|uniref:Uncharacterized protein n=1 Tax=Pleurodeles waltl TaxID=8319 RepID=A0AAV7UUM7_PLEWA|nr:hypothetical protein NDU88_001398 [Pleurodeles waltl]